MPNPFERIKQDLQVGGETFQFYSLPALGDARVETLPYSIRILLEAALRNCDNFQVAERDVHNILDWQQTAGNVEIPFKPARVILQDFTGVPAVVDLAAMRDAMKRLGGEARQINPLVPVDLVIDHSVQVDVSRTADAVEQNQALEFARNSERFRFLKWGAGAFDGLLIVPPGSGIVHQVNLEYLARVVFRGGAGNEAEGKLLYPDSLVGTDSHTTMINGLGVCGWGVGGIEAEAVMLGQPMSMVLPPVVGVRLSGQLSPHATATDLVLTITQMLRAKDVVGQFVEFFGAGVSQLALADRATISNMAPEYGATMGFFPVDAATLHYLTQTGRSAEQVQYIEAYLRRQGLFHTAGSDEQIRYTSVLDLDLATVVPCLAGPKRPHDRVPLAAMKGDFAACLTNKVGFKGYGLTPADASKTAVLRYEGQEYTLAHGAVAIAAITSCTNTSNPSVMLGAALLARNAVNAGLSVRPYIKTSLSPGSGVARVYLQQSGLQPYLDTLGFNVTGYGCMTCIGNSGELPVEVSEAIQANDLVAAGVLSGNRNFEGRIHAHLRANYLASPPLVVAYAIAGTVNIDFDTEPIGVSSKTGQAVFLKDIWPSRSDVQALIAQHVLPEMFISVYASIKSGTERWNSLQAPAGELYPWDNTSTYINNPPFFQTMGMEPSPRQALEKAYCLLNLGDSITTDHISPAGNISRNSPAGRYLAARGVDARDFNTYGARRGNDEVMVRGTFANSRIINKLLGKASAQTLHVPSGEVLDIYDAAERYMRDGEVTIVLAGREYGSGSSRDWAAKGPYMQGIKAVIAQSFERIHRSNLVGMGVVPLQFQEGQSADTLGLTGKETFTIDLSGELQCGQQVNVVTSTGVTFGAKLRFDTPIEIEYYRHGGILPYVLRRLLRK